LDIDVDMSLDGFDDGKATIFASAAFDYHTLYICFWDDISIL